MKAKPLCYVAFLLDRSGSMSSIQAQTIEGFNEYLAGLQADKETKINFTFLQFDSVSLDKLVVGAPVKSVPFLTTQTFVPRGQTPLIDAAWNTIKAVEAAVSNEKKAKVVICIQTDGYENYSVEHSWADLSALVKEKQEDGWQFNFMGAGIDAYQQASAMGIAAVNTVSYGKDIGATRAAFTASSANASNFLSGMSASTAYSAEQKLRSGDKFDKSA